MDKVNFLDEWNSYIEIGKNDTKGWNALESHLKATEYWHFSKCLSCNSVNEACWINTDNGYESATPCRYCQQVGQLMRVEVSNV
jgi:succinate dehydrogenase/fumarate reductase-like Fe-S protein